MMDHSLTRRGQPCWYKAVKPRRSIHRSRAPSAPSAFDLCIIHTPYLCFSPPPLLPQHSLYVYSLTSGISRSMIHSCSKLPSMSYSKNTSAITRRMSTYSNYSMMYVLFLPLCSPRNPFVVINSLDLFTFFFLSFLDHIPNRIGSTDRSIDSPRRLS
jgi:hypothetical protein